MLLLSSIAIWLLYSSNSTPAYPGGAILAWIICNAAKRNPIGGWLLFFYWQLYGGLLMTALLFSTNIQSYVRENFDSGEKFYLFLLSVVPTLILYLAQVAVGTILLSARTWDLLKLLRWLVAGGFVAELVSIVISINYYPDNIALNLLTIVQQTFWLAYLFNSVRVKHVFETHDWDIAVKSIHPEQPKVVT